ncbi:unnamed protein product [Camellia sinensis]
MSSGRLPMMELKPAHDVENSNSERRIQHELWPLGEIDPKKAKFPCCLVWTPLPVVSWLTPFIGHVGICREDGTVIDFSGSNFVSVDDFAFGGVARYLQLDREQCMPSRGLQSLGTMHSREALATLSTNPITSSPVTATRLSPIV